MCGPVGTSVRNCGVVRSALGDVDVDRVADDDSNTAVSSLTVVPVPVPRLMMAHCSPWRDRDVELGESGEMGGGEVLHVYVVTDTVGARAG